MSVLLGRVRCECLSGLGKRYSLAEETVCEAFS
jgi:hypothetical protein